ncbi:hypothetical protein CpipJ_CPIJ001568 [Culex quinquefasciatus]|uniref:Uncharacterized protein n=1 Tax=Culex quinquefasciatus TaxID=7176 RepID=B0W2W8_CULQU|nr:hypothetical protein CpipJ_CPIJ001568 [Culex quinquefasciatus]|eukprot:XP_001843052.1 hypothetical protein CpipJ_CPIJ001568 [Culex quinquefasciatus]
MVKDQAEKPFGYSDNIGAMAFSRLVLGEIALDERKTATKCTR